MSQQQRKVKRLAGGQADRVRKMELEFKKIKSEIQQLTSQLEAQAVWVRDLDKRLTDQILDLQNQVRERVATLNPDGLITLEEGCAVNLEELENKMEEKYSLLIAREKELDNLEKKISAELERLRSEIRERDLLLAARETELKGLRQALSARIEELEILAKSQAGGRGRTHRFVSFLADIGKKH